MGAGAIPPGTSGEPRDRPWRHLTPHVPAFCRHADARRAGRKGPYWGLLTWFCGYPQDNGSGRQKSVIAIDQMQGVEINLSVAAVEVGHLGKGLRIAPNSAPRSAGVAY